MNESQGGKIVLMRRGVKLARGSRTMVRGERGARGGRRSERRWRDVGRDDGSRFRESWFMTSKRKQWDRMEGSLAETDEVQPDAMVQHSFRRQAEQLLGHMVIGRSSGQHNHFESSTL